LRSYEQLIRLHIIPRFGEKKLTEIQRNAIKEFVSDISHATRIADEQTGETVPKFSRNTLRLIICALRAVLNAAMEDGLIESNPAVRMGRFAKSAKPTHQASAMTREEVGEFLTAVREVCPEWYPFFLSALRAGLRKGELIALKWGDIQFGADESDANRYILVQRNWACGQFTTPKSKKSRRVDLSLHLRRTLMDLRAKRLIDAAKLGRTSIADDLVFPSQAGTPIKPDNIAVRYMQPALEKAGLRTFRFHDLRHTFGSLLIQDCASLAYVRDQMGHSSIQITADVYGHLIPGADISWIDTLDGEQRQQQSATPAQPEQHALAEDDAKVVDSNWLPPRESYRLKTQDIVSPFDMDIPTCIPRKSRFLLAVNHASGDEKLQQLSA
jgi:integrase